MINHIETSEPLVPVRQTWRDPQTYRPLLMLDRPGWAWEWLRRNRAYGALAITLPPAIRCILRATPRITLITQRHGEEDIFPWGLHFRGMAWTRRRWSRDSMAQGGRRHGAAGVGKPRRADRSEHFRPHAASISGHHIPGCRRC